MDSKERVWTAIRRAKPDRLPLDFQANPWVLERLHRDLGTTSHRQLLEGLHCDIVDLRGVVETRYVGPIPASRELGNGIRENFWGWRQKIIQSATGPEDCFVQFVLAKATSIEDYQRHRWPQADWFDFSHYAEALPDWNGMALLASGASVFQHATFLRGIDALLMDMAVQPEMAHWLMDRFTHFYLDFFDRLLSAAAGRIDILRVADDLGTQRGLFFSPDMFRMFLKPRLKKLADLAHHHQAAFMFHSCGAIRPLIDDLIEIGVDILDPLQAAAEGMDPQTLKDAYGDRLCLHGGICTQYLLPRGTVDQVRREVQRRCEILGRGGGYIVAPCHVLQTDVPTVNILAAIQAALAWPNSSS